MTWPCDALRRLPKSFLHPCLLLLLKEQPDYGYDLVIRLKVLGIDDDSAAVYRALRTLEEQRAVSSYWCMSSTGPARRMYELTPVGEEYLQAAVEAAAETHRAIERFFCRHALAQSCAQEPDTNGSAVPTTLQRLAGRKSVSTGAGPPERPSAGGRLTGSDRIGHFVERNGVAAGDFG